MNLEDHVISTVHSAIADAIKTNLVGYNSPMDAFIRSAFEKHKDKIQAVFDGAVIDCMTKDFGAALQDACAKKLAKVLISKMEGEIEKRANNLRANPEFRARLTIAITDTLKGIGA